MIFIAMDNLQNDVSSHNGRPRVAKRMAQLTTVRAFETLRNGTMERQTTPLTKGTFNESDLVEAIRADKPFGGRSTHRAAKLTNLGIKKAKGGVHPVGKRMNQ